MPSRQAILSLYKSLLREGSKLESYSYRNYVLRKVKHSFRENKNVNDLNEQEFIKGVDGLQIIKRQVLIGDMYKTDKLVIEKV